MNSDCRFENANSKWTNNEECNEIEDTCEAKVPNCNYQIKPLNERKFGAQVTDIDLG